MARQYQGKVPVVGMAGRDSTGPMRDFVDRHGLGFLAHAVDDDGSLWSSFGVRHQPAWVFIDKSGKTTLAFGPQSQSEIRKQLDAIAAS